MSQAKVDQHKRDKANREQIMRKERLSRALTALLGIVVVAAIAFWIGFSVYKKQEAKALENIEYTEINPSALDDFEASLGE